MTDERTTLARLALDKRLQEFWDEVLRRIEHSEGFSEPEQAVVLDMASSWDT